MQFDKPTILPRHISDILEPYSLGTILETTNLGGIPNNTFKVVTDERTIAIRIYSHGQSSIEHIDLELRVLGHLAKLDFISPRPIKGRNGKILQTWNGYPLLATEFIDGEMAENLTITKDLTFQTGSLATSFKDAMSSFPLERIPEGETWLERGDNVISTIEEDRKNRGFEMDLRNVPEQWERSSRPFRDNSSNLYSNVIHADFWPPNIKVKDNKIVGLMDFDDCCYGATIIDVSIALMELSMFNATDMNPVLAQALIDGYFKAGGSMTELEKTLIVDAIEMTCAIWLGYNIVQAPKLEQANIYLERLNKLWDDHYQAKIRRDVLEMIRVSERG